MSKAAFREKLRLAREAKRTGAAISHDDVDEDVAIYDEVDEDEFRVHKRNQMMADDFIVDDDGLGYQDNGIDEWDNSTRPNYYSDESEGEGEDSGSKAMKKAKKDRKPVKKTAQIGNFFQQVNKANPVPVKKVDADFDDILEDFSVPAKKKPKSSNPFSTVKKNVIKKKNSGFDFSTAKRKKLAIKSEDNTVEAAYAKPPSSPIKAGKFDSDPLETNKENMISSEIQPDDEDVDMSSDSDDDVVMRKPRVTGVVKHDTTISTVKSSISAKPASPVREIEAKTAISSSPYRPSLASDQSYTEKLDESKIIGEGDDESFKMFWLDHCEINNTLLLFGKVLTREGKYVSGVAQVNGLYREIYVLPRRYRRVDGEDTEEEVTPLDVHEELVPLLLDKFGLDSIRAKPEKMKYAFELPGIPKEAQYLKILLPYNTPKNQGLVLPSELEGETFSHVFGTNANVFESFVLQRNIMGPCWLNIENPDFESFRNASHCQVEVSISAPNFISPVENSNVPPPALTVTSISVQTVMDNTKNKQEVASVSFATYRNIPQDAPIDPSLKPNELVTLIRPINSVSLPPGIQQIAQKQGFNLRAMPNEKSLLSFVTAYIKNADPDVFVGHRLENISLDVLVHRMYDLKVPTWSSLGRRSRKVWPERFGRNSNGFNNNLQLREVFQGRLLCDIANEMGQSLTSKCQSWDLPEMYEVVCNKKHSGLEVNYQNKNYTEDSTLLLMALKDNASNAQITAEISFVIQILSLSKQLTNLAGNAWSHTLSGTRAGRNEYILLHEFKRNDYIVPDKEDRFRKNTKVDNDDDSNTVSSNKKSKYQGGLVFEPEKGLHKNYILVMDFNSLYPSIIQEFNICFTTVDRDEFNITHDEEKDLPKFPEKESIPGVLPKLLNALVTRRREVKKLLKDPKNTAVERAQYDIKQQALKLTANSMYGCLGYVNSRFYAKPLAMLVTNKGREILMDTRQLAESIGLRVVYGDTDSVMIDTGVDSFEEALKIGNDFKVEVNQRYRLLEIDTDNVFKRLLLHAKKKYAAVNASIDKKTGKEITNLEVKGLDMRRREYCQLSKDMSTYVLQKLLSDTDPEQALSEIYDYLEEMAAKMKNYEIPVDKYKINTRLSKDPNNYPNGKTMPPVQVALRLRNEGKVIKAGSVITYVVTETTDDTQTTAERARAIQEVLKKDSGYKPDVNFYLEKQIFAPIERLMERIEGVDMVRVAKSLGIDTRRYILRVKNSDNGEIAPLESKISDAERFRQSSYLVLNCKCGAKFRFGGILASNDYQMTFNGITCKECDTTFSTLKITSQLESTIRRHIATYYAGWVMCDDTACGITTRQISVFGKRCIGASGTAHGCKGIMRYKYSSKALYNQLLYFNSIFDVDKAKHNELKPIYDFTEDKHPQKLPSGQVEALAEQNRELFGYCQEVVQKYLADCGRRYVDMGSIFDFAATK